MACISVHFWKGACADEGFFEIAITFLHELPILFKNKLQWLKYGPLPSGIFSTNFRHFEANTCRNSELELVAQLD